MKLPNVASIIFITALAAALEYVASGAQQAYSAWWVPVLVLVVGAIAKGLQVYVQGAKDADAVRSADERKANGLVRRTLLD
jgi:hypothetical protein